jgi:hypothetical protein
MFDRILNGHRAAPKPNNGAEAPKSSAFAELIRKPDFNRETDLIGKDFHGQDFGKTDLDGFDFSGADLRGADLQHVQNIGMALWHNAILEDEEKPVKLPANVKPDDIQAPRD